MPRTKARADFVEGQLRQQQQQQWLQQQRLAVLLQLPPRLRRQCLRAAGPRGGVPRAQREVLPVLAAKQRGEQRLAPREAPREQRRVVHPRGVELAVEALEAPRKALPPART